MHSSVLIFDHPQPGKSSLGADHVSSNSKLENSIFRNRKVMVFNLNREFKPTAMDKISQLANVPESPRLVLVSSDLTGEELRQCSKDKGVFAVLRDWGEDLEGQIQAAAAYQSSDEIEQQLDALAESENIQLKNLSHELEDTVKKREQNLLRAQKRIMTINRQVESMFRALQAAHIAESVGEVERLLMEVMKDHLQLSLVRVLFSDNAAVETQLQRHPTLKCFKVSLLVGTRSLGKIIFAKEDSGFSKSDEDFLGQVAEGVALAIDRLTKLEQAESLKQQWESTFDAISEPLCLADTDFNILKTNKSYSETTQKTERELIGQNCFQAFVGRGSKAPVLEGSRLKVERVQGQGEIRTFEIHTQQIGNPGGSRFLMLMFRDISDQQKIERQIFESAKMAEIGTVGSSIAHELNNPLGGMISFLQLIKMDLKEDDPLYQDIVAMESAGKRCKEIIENLLGFSRSQDSLEQKTCDLIKVIQQTLKLAELKSRSAGISVEVKSPVAELNVLGNPNLLAQALNHILQNSLDAIEIRSQSDPRFRGKIQVEIQNDPGRPVILIRDNGVGMEPESLSKALTPLFSTKGKNFAGLGLTLAFKIINEHGGQLEISSQPHVGTEVKISLSNV